MAFISENKSEEDIGKNKEIKVEKPKKMDIKMEKS